MFSVLAIPFLFLVPLFLTVFAVRAGTSLFRNGPGQHSGQRSGQRIEELYPSHPWASAVNREAQVFQLANRLKGRITVSDVVIETGIGVEEAEQLMQRLVDNTRVRMEVAENGLVTYEFPEIISRYERS